MFTFWYTMSVILVESTTKWRLTNFVGYFLRDMQLFWSDVNLLWATHCVVYVLCQKWCNFFWDNIKNIYLMHAPEETEWWEEGAFFVSECKLCPEALFSATKSRPKKTRPKSDAIMKCSPDYCFFFRLASPP